MADNTVEVVSVHGIGTSVALHRAAVEAMLPKYWKPEEFEATREFLASNAMVHVRPTRAYAIIETEADFSATATRWVW
jgi:hypothetical protein